MAQDNPNFPIGTAAINWTDGQGQVHIRVYSTDGYNVTERCWDGSSWATGQFKAPGSDVSATSWLDSNGKIHIRVYCTFQDKTVEWCNDTASGWGQGAYTTT